MFRVLAVAALVSSVGGMEVLTVPVGGQKVLKLSNLEQVAIGNTAIADVKMVGQAEVLVVGVSPGRTTLRVWTVGAKAPTDLPVEVTAAGQAVPATKGGADVTPPPVWSPVLKVGASLTRATPGLSRIAVGDPGVADLESVSEAIVLKGVAPGRTTVIAWFGDGRRESWAVTVVK